MSDFSTLKAGDKVILNRGGFSPFRTVEKVEHITPSGNIITVDGLRFRPSGTRILGQKASYTTYERLERWTPELEADIIQKNKRTNNIYLYNKTPADSLNNEQLEAIVSIIKKKECLKMSDFAGLKAGDKVVLSLGRWHVVRSIETIDKVTTSGKVINVAGMRFRTLDGKRISNYDASEHIDALTPELEAEVNKENRRQHNIKIVRTINDNALTDEQLEAIASAIRYCELKQRTGLIPHNI